MLDAHSLIDLSYVTQCLYVIVKLGLLEPLAKNKRSAQELASLAHASEEQLHPVLLTLQSFGYLRIDADNTYSLSEKSAMLLDEKNLWLKEYLLLWGEQLNPAFCKLYEMTVTGKPAFEIAYKKTIWDHYRSDETAGSRFVAFMDAVSRWQGPVIARSLEGREFNCVIDVGGGSGSLLTAVLLEYPELTGVVYDQAHLADSARARIAALSLGQRCSFHAGNFLESSPPAADLYLIKHVIHDWCDEDAIRILCNIRQSMTEASTLVLIEGVLDGGVKDKIWLKTRHMEQMAWTGGRVRTKAEFVRLLASARLTIKKTVDTDINDCSLLYCQSAR